MTALGSPLSAAEFPDVRSPYLNSASIGPIPKRTALAIDEINLRRRAPDSFRDADLLDILVRARSAAAHLIHADPAEIALATNTSFGLNQAAQALPLGSGDVVLVPEGEFPANVYPWLRLKRRGVRVEFIPRTSAGWPDEARLFERLDDPRVRAVAISLVQFSTGWRVDLAGLSSACRARNVFLIVDAIQGVGSVPLNVRTTPVDILSSGAQKWLLGPWGSGFTYVRRELAETLEPASAGWMAFAGTDDFSRLTDYDDQWHPDARRFEMVTLPFQDLAGMTASLGLIVELNPATILDHVRALRAPLVEAAEGGAFTIVSPLDDVHDSAIIAVRPPDPPAAYERLRAAGVTCALREGIVRLSPHAFNTENDMACALDALEQKG